MIWDSEVRLWWMILAATALVNVVLWLFLMRKCGSRIFYWASGFYVFGCAFRSLLPRADVQRVTLFNGFVSSVFVGRSVATLAELGFALQWGMVLNLLGKKTQNPWVRRVGFLVFPLIFVAEIFSWYAVLTTNYLGSVFEESLWGLTFALVSFAIFSLRKDLGKSGKTIALYVCLGLLLYVGYMFLVDVPMYYRRWVYDRQDGLPVLTPLQGLRDVLTHWTVSRSYADWRSEMLWMTLYFGPGVWSSLLLNLVPGHFSRFRTKSK